MQKRKPGNLEVSAIGLGGMSLNFGYGQHRGECGNETLLSV